MGHPVLVEYEDEGSVWYWYDSRRFMADNQSFYKYYEFVQLAEDIRDIPFIESRACSRCSWVKKAFDTVEGPSGLHPFIREFMGMVP